MAKHEKQQTGEEQEKQQAVDSMQHTGEEQGLIVMFKGAEKIAVHPTTVKSHEEAGWKVQK